MVFMRCSFAHGSQEKTCDRDSERALYSADVKPISGEAEENYPVARNAAACVIPPPCAGLPRLSLRCKCRQSRAGMQGMRSNIAPTEVSKMTLSVLGMMMDSSGWDVMFYQICEKPRITAMQG